VRAAKPACDGVIAGPGVDATEDGAALDTRSATDENGCSFVAGRAGPVFGSLIPITEAGGRWF
jgi:hypothetical protein